MQSCSEIGELRRVLTGAAGDRTIEARKEILVNQRELLVTRMKEMQKTLDILDHKIEVYENAVLKKEKGIIQTEE